MGEAASTDSPDSPSTDPAGKILKENHAGTAAKQIIAEGPLPAGTHKVEAAIRSAIQSVQTGTPALTGAATYVSS